jgi:uncharacterized Zn finger protein
MSDDEWPPLTEAAIREIASSKSYQRGQSYREQGAVSDVVRRSHTVRADVEGSQYQPYTVTIEFDDAGIAGTDCPCPYDHGGICKHRVAVLLTCIRDPERVREQPPMSELIADEDRETLEKLLVELVETRPELAGWIETRLETSAVADGADTGESASTFSGCRRATNEWLSNETKFERSERRSLHQSSTGWTGQFELSTTAESSLRMRVLRLAAGEHTGHSRSADRSQ